MLSGLPGEMTPLSAVRLWLLSNSAQILFSYGCQPAAPGPDGCITDEAEHGRGLMLVEAVSEQWGWYSPEDGDGKFVWAIAKLCIPGEAIPGDNNGYLRAFCRARLYMDP